MESCSICCFPYSDLQDSNNTRIRRELCCNHSLCESCYLRLDKAQCPFCRLQFQYSIEDLKKRKSLNLEYFKWQPPSQITNYIPSEITRRRATHINILPSIQEEDINIPNQPFSRVRKNMNRRRRRDLTFDEVLERRRIIRKRCKKKWTHKDGRMNKERHYINNDTEVF